MTHRELGVRLMGIDDPPAIQFEVGRIEADAHGDVVTAAVSDYKDDDAHDAVQAGLPPRQSPP